MEQNYIIIIGLLLAFYIYKLISGRLKYTKLKGLIDSGEAFDLIDVRTAGEFNSGHIPGAINIPVDKMSSKMSKLSKKRTVVLYCQSGSRASGALATLKHGGFINVWNFGGISRWHGKLDK
jgi:phage shock protein E